MTSLDLHHDGEELVLPELHEFLDSLKCSCSQAPVMLRFIW